MAFTSNETPGLLCQQSRRGAIMRLAVAVALSCLAISSVLASQHADAAIGRKETNIAAQPLGAALEQFARDRDLQLVYATDEVGSVRSGGAVGNLTASDALAQLLQGTGLIYRFLDEHTVTVQASASAQSTPVGAPPEGAVGPADVAGASLARHSSDRAVSDTATLNESTPTGSALEEVIVTAQKKAERLQDVPIPMTVVGGSELAETNQFRLQDYSSQVPGLSVTSSDAGGSPMLGIRGIAPAPFGNPTVGVMLDGIPLGSETALGGGYVTPELDPSDLQRIEILRGPQGTLFGAASMGGLLKYETVDPSLSQWNGRVEGGLAGVRNGRNPGYDVSGAVNMPVNNTFGIRASGFARSEPGYVDNVQTGAHGVNGTRIAGGHLSALWRPLDTFSVKLSALFESNKQAGEPYAMIGPGLGDLQQVFMPNAGRLARKFEAYSATAHAKFGAVDLTSVTGYNISHQLTPLDNSVNVGPLVSQAFPTSYAFEIDSVINKKFIQELRVSMPLGGHLQWLVGGYFTHETTPSYTKYLATSPDSTPLGDFALLGSEVRFTEWAAFTDLTYSVTERFDIQIGGRSSRMTQSFDEIDRGLYVPIVEGVSSPNQYPRAVARESASTYLLTPRLRITPDIMLYARIASGFRPGGTNIGVIPPGAPRDFKPDRTQNYEVGIKADVLDHKVAFEGALYRIDWKDIQLFLNLPGTAFGYYSNGSQAKSQGLELSVNARPLQGLHTGAWVTWNQSVLTRDMPPNSVNLGVSGNPLPYSSRFSASAAVDYGISVARATLSLASALSYVGERYGSFLPTADRQVYPAYAKTDFRASWVLDSWTWNLYLNNAFDRRGVVGGGLGTYYPNAFDIIQPRTIGSSLAINF
jgi:outer membrane receptor protein involved in Fe transport